LAKLPQSRGIKVIGIGNEWRCDDAVGLLAARRLRDMKPAGIKVLESRGFAASLLESWQGSPKVIVVDAMASGANPGAVSRFAAHQAPLPVKFFASGSSHTLGLAQIVEMGRALGQLPPYLIVLGVEGRTFALGQGLSPEVEAAIPRVIQEILKELPQHLRLV
jgi:hydrogenase maturation protease